MKIKTLLCTIALGAFALASCDKPEPEQPNKPQPQPEPEPEVVEPKLADVKTVVEENTISISGAVADFTFVSQEKTPVGVWSATADSQKKEVAGTYKAEGKLVEGKIIDLEAGKTYSVGTFVTIDGKKFYSKGAEVSIEAPKPVETPVQFSEVAATAEGQKVTISGKTADFTFVDDATTPVGIWYTLEGQTEKTKAEATFNKEASTITGIIAELAYGKYTAGVYAKEDNKEQFSEGVELVLAEPEPEVQITFSEVKATWGGNKVSIEGKVEGFEFVDETTTPAGIWYSSDNGVTKTEKTCKYWTMFKSVKGDFADMAEGIYKVGIFVEKDGQKYYSEGIETSYIQPPVFSEVTAQLDGKKISASGKVADFTFVDAETSTVGLWYTIDLVRKEARGEYDVNTQTITAITKDLPVGEYTVGIWAKKGGIKHYSEQSVVLTIEANPGFHLPEFGDGTEF